MKAKRIFQNALLVLISLACSCGTCQGCAKDWDSEWSGIERHIILYSFDGSIIREWHGNIFVEETEGEGLSFLYEGKRYIFSGCYLVEEL